MMLWHKLTQHSFKTRIILVTLMILWVGIWSLTAYISEVLHRDMVRVLGAQQLSTASLIATEVSHEIESRINGLHAVAVGIRPAHVQNSSDLQSLLEARPVLQTLFNDGVAFAGLDGTVIAGHPKVPGRIGANFKERDYAIGTLVEGHATVGTPLRSKINHDPSFVIAVPVRDDKGRVMGALAGVINLGRPNFLDQITDNRYSHNGSHLIVVPKSRLIVTATDRHRVLETLPPVGVSPALDRFIDGYEGSAIFNNPEGVEVLTSVKSEPLTGWHIATILPITEAFAPIRLMQERMLAASVLLTLLAGAGMWWVLQRQLAPVLDAAKTLATLAFSDQPLQPLPVGRQDEIGDLINGFNRLLNILGQREAALHESEENLAITLHSIGDAVVATDTAGCVMRMNAVAEQLCGWPLADAKGRLLSDVLRMVHADTRQAIPNPVQRVMQTGQVVALTNHTVLLTHDNRELHIADSAAPIRNTMGDIVGVVLVFRDVTDKVEMELALRESEELYRAVTNQGQALIWLAGLDKGCYYFNQPWLDFTGRTLAQESGNGWAEGVHPDDLQRCFDIYLTAFGRRESFSMVYRLRRHDGEYRWILDDGTPRYDSRHVFVGYIGHCLDVTESKRAEEALQKSEFLWKFAIEGAGDGVWDWYIQTGQAEYSVRWKAMLGYADSEIKNELSEWSSRVHPQDLPVVMQTVQAHMDGDTPSATVEYRILCKNGTWCWVLGRGMVVSRDADNKPLRLIGTNTDITERKQVEDVTAFLSQVGGEIAGEPFFDALARFLANALDMDYVCIDRLEGDCLNATTLAVWHDGRFEANVTYALCDTPCGEVVGKKVCCYPASVCQLFPEDKALLELCADSYIGVTLWSHTGQPIGLIAVIGRHPLANRAFAEATLERVGLRASAELERMDAEIALQQSETRYRTLIDWTREAIAVHRDMRLIYVNPATVAMLGAPSAQHLLGRSFLDFVHPDFHQFVRGRHWFTSIPNILNLTILYIIANFMYSFKRGLILRYVK